VPQAVAAAAPLASTSRHATWPHQRARRLAEPSQGRGPPDLSQGTRIRCNVDGIRCVMVAADRPWPHQNAKPTGQEALDAAAHCVVAWSRPGAPCCRTRRSGHGAAGSGRGSSPCDHAASAVASPTPRRGEEGCGGKEGEHGKGLAAAVLAAARTPGGALKRRRGWRSGEGGATAGAMGFHPSRPRERRGGRVHKSLTSSISSMIFNGTPWSLLRC